MALSRATTSDFIACRTLGHAWDPVPSDGSRTPHGGDPFWLRCARCSAERHDEVTWGTGELLGRRYVYDDRYRHAFDDQFSDATPTRQDFRRLMLAEHLQNVRRLRAAKRSA